ncbi:hypothetical protein CVT25_015471 [Psilocybe cyanescens]|uniref:Uncharacterized protein n=1 Tax=Psilocybe cyanescens TaxID=93625 RepID=A0A409X567_PSICY|nr:hypothetical protein CVT25_015471 [Psilocybe cyanescens]
MALKIMDLLSGKWDPQKEQIDMNPPIYNSDAIDGGDIPIIREGLVEGGLDEVFRIFTEGAVCNEPYQIIHNDGDPTRFTAEIATYTTTRPDDADAGLAICYEEENNRLDITKVLPDQPE